MEVSIVGVILAVHDFLLFLSVYRVNEAHSNVC